MAGRRLDEDDVAQFAALGWVLLPDLLDLDVGALQDEVTRVAEWGDDGAWLNHYEMTAGGRALARTENFTPFSPVLADLLCKGAVPRAAGRLLGEPALLYKEKINFKAAGGAGFSPHQDKPAYPFVDVVLSVMIAVDDSTVANGCLWVTDAQHRFVLAQDDRGCVRDDVASNFDWHPVELRAGETLFFDALTPHKSGPNTSERDRRALYPTYNGVSEGDLRESYYVEKLRAFEAPDNEDRVRLSLIGDFEGRPA